MRHAIVRRKVFAFTFVFLFAFSGSFLVVAGRANNAAAYSSQSPPIPPGIENPIMAYSPPAVQNEFSWSGGAYPVFNGKVMYPPLASRVISNDSPKTHWYAGSTFTGTAANATWLYSKITVPSSNPPSTDFYYVLASLWDNNASYDQIDFAADYGVWGLTYSWTSGLNPSCQGTLHYHYNPDAMNLTPGTTYRFYIATLSNGLWFEAYVGRTLVWYLHANTSKTKLAITQYYCGYYGYTDYEEVYAVTYGHPNFDFHFALNQYKLGGSWTPATWGTFYISSPAGVLVTISSKRPQSVSIDND